MTRQVQRAQLRAQYNKLYRVNPDAHGTRQNPIMPRAERRKLARAFASRAWRKGKQSQ